MTHDETRLERDLEAADEVLRDREMTIKQHEATIAAADRMLKALPFDFGSNNWYEACDQVVREVNDLKRANDLNNRVSADLYAENQQLRASEGAYRQIMVALKDMAAEVLNVPAIPKPKQSEITEVLIEAGKRWMNLYGACPMHGLVMEMHRCRDYDGQVFGPDGYAPMGYAAARAYLIP